MKIVQINGVYQYASTGRTTYEMHHYFLEHGINSYVFYGNKAMILDDNVYPIGNIVDHKVHALLSRLVGKQGYFSHKATKTLIESLSRISPDVVILRVLHGNYINLPMLLQFLASKDIASVIVLHDCWYFTGHCNYYSSVDCFKWKKECHQCPRLHDGGGNNSWFFDTSSKVFRDKMRNFSLINKLAVIGVSNWITEEASVAPVFSKVKIIRRIYNWIDTSIFYQNKDNNIRTRLDINVDDFVVLGVASGWKGHKGLNEFIEIAVKNSDCRVVLVGKMDMEVSLPTNLLAVGSIENTRELAKYYNMADVFISPSKQETFGKVIAEALACGTPCIVNNTTAMPELVADGCGYVVDNNNVDDYCRYIRMVKDKKKSSFSKNCINKAHTSFNRNNNIEQYLRLFDELI